jgi:hypothetical protein
MKRPIVLLALLFGSGCGSATASEFNPLDFYVGASVGRSDDRTSIAPDPLYRFDASDTGWKVLIGLRPIPLIAGELSYVNFGHPTSVTNVGAYTLRANALQRAETLSGLIFAPIPLPALDVYARLGLARLDVGSNGSLSCNPGYECPADVLPLAFDRTHYDFLWGAGAQLKFSPFALRLEYERIDDARGNPVLLSAGVTWTF